MRSTRSVEEVVGNLSEYVDRVARHRECLLLTRGGVAVAELCPVQDPVRLRELPELLASLPRLPESEAAEMGADLDHARRRLPTAP